MKNAETVEPTEIVKANNELFRCQFKIKDVVAGRIFMAFASLVDHKDVKENQEFVEYQISAKSIIQDIHAGSDYYDQLFEAASSLVKHTIKQQNYKNEFVVYSLFSKIQYKDQIITGQLHKDLVPFFIIAREQFTKMKLSEYMKLPSIYSQALFGFLRSWSDKDEIVIKVLELHKMLSTPESFRKNFADFQKRVLEKAHKDINKLTSLRYDYEPIKNGRSYTEIKFKFIKLPMRRTKQSVIPQSLSDIEKQNSPNFHFRQFVRSFINHGVLYEAAPLFIELYKSGIAPTADDVPPGTTLSVLDFLKQWQASRK